MSPRNLLRTFLYEHTSMTLLRFAKLFQAPSRAGVDQSQVLLLHHLPTVLRHVRKSRKPESLNVSYGVRKDLQYRTCHPASEVPHLRWSQPFACHLFRRQ